MAVTGASLFPRFACIALASAFLCSTSARGDTEADLRSQINHVAAALTAGDPTGALAPFSRSFSRYEVLRAYFKGLTDAYTIENEVDVLEEEDTESEATAKLRWAITLSNPDTNLSENRSAEIAIRFKRIRGEWRITDLVPIDIFNPAASPKPPLPKL